MERPRRYIRMATFAVVVILASTSACLYCESYLNHRKDSGYYLTQSGEIRWAVGMAVSDLEQWSPATCWWQPGFVNVYGERSPRGNFAGYLYAPLIAWDRRINYPDRRILTREDIEEAREGSEEL